METDQAKKLDCNLGTWNRQGTTWKLNEAITERNNLHTDLAVLSETERKSQGLENLGSRSIYTVVYGRWGE